MTNTTWAKIEAGWYEGLINGTLYHIIKNPYTGWRDDPMDPWTVFMVDPTDPYKRSEICRTGSLAQAKEHAETR